MADSVLISGTLLGTRRLVQELGGDPQSLAVQAGLSPRTFERPDMFVPAAPIVDFLELAANACGCPSFALEHARRLPLGRRDQGWMLMRTAATVREGLRDFVNIYGLYTDAGSLGLQTERGAIWLSYRFAPVGRWGETQIIHLTLARLCLLVGEMLGRSWQPAQVTLKATPTDHAAFEAFFGPGVQFGQPRDAVLIDAPTLAEPVLPLGETRARSTRPDPSAAALRQFESEVRSLLAPLLRLHGNSIETVARALGISSRTLQRRLNDSGTTYRAVVDSVRADMGWRHVTRTRLDLAQVAGLLGYESQTAFSRAFRRWYAMSPRDARRRI